MSLAPLLSTTPLSRGEIRLKASTEDLKYNNRMQSTKTRCLTKLNQRSQRTQPQQAKLLHPAVAAAPCDCSELSSILLQHPSPWSQWQVTRLEGTLMPSSPSDAHSSPSTQPKRIHGLWWDEILNAIGALWYHTISMQYKRNNHGWMWICLDREPVWWVCVL